MIKLYLFPGRGLLSQVLCIVVPMITSDMVHWTRIKHRRTSCEYIIDKFFYLPVAPLFSHDPHGKGKGGDTDNHPFFYHSDG